MRKNNDDETELVATLLSFVKRVRPPVCLRSDPPTAHL